MARSLSLAREAWKRVKPCLKGNATVSLGSDSCSAPPSVESDRRVATHRGGGEGSPSRVGCGPTESDGKEEGIARDARPPTSRHSWSLTGQVEPAHGRTHRPASDPFPPAFIDHTLRPQVPRNENSVLKATRGRLSYGET